MSRISDELRGRTKEFAARAIRLFRKLPSHSRDTQVVGHQLLRSATSVAANVREASRARSDEEFVSKLGIALQEADEAQLWMELLGEECGISDELLEGMLSESNELIAILVTIIHRVRTQRS